MQDFSADIAAIGSIDAVPTILDLACRVTGMRFAAVARVTESRWVCCAVQDNIALGLQPGGELKVETTLCHEVRQGRQIVVIDEVATDPLYRDHHTPAMYGFQSYISVPIFRKDGSFFGTLCALDPEPRRPRTAEVVGMFTLFAELIALHLDAADRLAATQAQLVDEQRDAEFREQFIAVLGHDLRNPLASIDAGARLLLRTPLDQKATQIVTMMQASITRMSGLITNVLDFARTRLGSGMLIERKSVDLTPVLDQVIAEFRTTHPDRVIETRLDLGTPVSCDPLRIAQLFSNLLGNALAYGTADRPVVVAASAAATFELSVANAGTPIPKETVGRLFRPFSRGAVPQNQQGLGLGLYIAAEIASAHGGTIDVASSADETRFTFRMPAR